MSALDFFNQRLRAKRKKLKLTQQQVADALNITRGAYGSYEEGRAEPRLYVLLRMANLFGCTLDELVGHAQPEPAETISPKTHCAPRAARRVAIVNPVSARPFLSWDHHS